MPSGEELAAVEKSFPGRIASVIADIRDEDQIQAAVDKIVAAEGALHGMVCNAGITNHKSALDFTKEEIERLFSINVSTSSSRHHHILLPNPYTLHNHRCSEHSIAPALPPAHSSNSTSPAPSSSPPQWPPTGPTNASRALPTAPPKPASATWPTLSPWSGHNTASASTASVRA